MTLSTRLCKDWGDDWKPAVVQPADRWAIVAYLQSHGRARELSGPEGETRAREGCDCPDDAMNQAHQCRMTMR